MRLPESLAREDQCNINRTKIAKPAANEQKLGSESDQSVNM